MKRKTLEVGSPLRRLMWMESPPPRLQLGQPGCGGGGGGVGVGVGVGGGGGGGGGGGESEG